DEARCGDGAEPLAHVALLEPGGVGDLAARGRRERGEGVEQAGVVADPGEYGDRAVVENLQEAPERLRELGPAGRSGLRLGLGGGMALLLVVAAGGVPALTTL